MAWWWLGSTANIRATRKGRRSIRAGSSSSRSSRCIQDSGRSVPVFNDKHLSWNWDWAKKMYDTSREMGFAFMAGSSLPVTWRTPSVEMPLGSRIREALCVCYGGVDSYDFHGLETIQCMVERRRGGETGVKWVQAYRGDNFWKAHERGRLAA